MAVETNYIQTQITDALLESLDREVRDDLLDAITNIEFIRRMVSPNRKRAIEIMCELKNDSLIGEQDIIFRKYIPLQTFGVGVNGMRFTNEWRCFFLGNKLLTFVYYWSNSFPKENIENFTQYIEMFLFDGGLEIAENAADIISKKTNFFVLDVARAENGNWYVVEANDGQMSGLNGTNIHSFYQLLKEEIKNFYE